MLDILSPQIGLIFFQTIIMLCVAICLKKFAWQSILSFIRQKEESYKVAINEANEAKETVARLRVVSEGIIGKANERSQRIVEQALATKQAFLEEAEQEAMAQKTVLMEKAQKKIEQAEVEAFEQVKKKAGALVVKTAQKLLAIELQAQYTQEKFLQKLLQESMQEQSMKGT